MANPRHFEAKWEEALGISLEGQWTEVWRRVHGTGCSLFVKSAIWRQINLNFWTTYMDYAYIARGDGLCPMCGEWARTRWHIVVECEVTKQVWGKLSATLERLVDGGVNGGEMVFGKAGQERGVKLRNRLGFTLRSAVHSLRGVRCGGVEESVDRVWSLFLSRLKKELVEEWYVAKLEGSVALFERDVLCGGVLGGLEDGVVVWAGLMEGVGYHYWQLF